MLPVSLTRKYSDALRNFFIRADNSVVAAIGSLFVDHA
jgi:hypothetical protein